MTGAGGAVSAFAGEGAALCLATIDRAVALGLAAAAGFAADFFAALAGVAAGGV